VFSFIGNSGFLKKIVIRIRSVHKGNFQAIQIKKLQPKYYGPFIVNEILSPTLVKLKDKNTGKLFKNLIHMDRLKIAFPMYFLCSWLLVVSSSRY
jgi:hypothetical protein